MVSWNEIHGHVTQRFQALFLLLCSCKTFLLSDDTVLVKMHHHDTIFKKCTRAPPPEWHDAWNLGHAHIAVRCPGRSMGESLPPGEMMKPGSCLQQMQMSLEGTGRRRRGGHVVEKAGVTMGSTGSRNLWPRKGSRACGMCRARVSGFQEDLGICLQVLESASQREVTGKEWL